MQAIRIVVKGENGVFLVAEPDARYRIVSGLAVTAGMPRLEATGAAGMVVDYDGVRGRGTVHLPSESGGFYTYQVTAA
ncbi:hypothetical protein SAMN05660657_04703 [Geodermatophilus amargosae]|uniref:Uncharacterized protein n=2 Tax=Geodermatophilus amargosae TaxID=1296565 RepID=A0A1I7CNW3_9ACTN|nr:hypothetical protein SAMN05660657_04703 [Geodermatophilus amargosae]